MKKFHSVCLLLALCCLLLCGCGCDHRWTDATCTQSMTCALCGKAEGEALGHDWVKSCEEQTCRRCGAIGDEALGHSWADATCAVASTCEICGATQGDTLPHHWTLADEATLRCDDCGGETAPKYIAMTFDDGPSGKYTDALLEALEQRNVHATFFLCGYRLETRQDQAQDIYDRGHELALHGYSHTLMHDLTKSEIRQELTDTLALLPEGCEVTLMRPPGGIITSDVTQVCKELGLAIILWSLDPQDWNTEDADQIKTSIVTQARAGDIILLHDMSTSSVDAAIAAIDELTADGFVFVTVSELARLQGETVAGGSCHKKFPGTT